MVFFTKAALIPRVLGSAALGPITAIAGGFLLGVAIGGIMANANVRERVENFVMVDVQNMLGVDQETQQERKCTCPGCLRRRRKERERLERGGQYADYYESDEDDATTENSFDGCSSYSSDYPATSRSEFTEDDHDDRASFSSVVRKRSVYYDDDDDDDDLYSVSKSLKNRLICELPENLQPSYYNSSSKMTPFGSSSSTSGQTTPNSKMD